MTSAQINVNQRILPTIAKSSWIPSSKEIEALSSRQHLNQMYRVDQIWPWLSENYPEVIALDAPHAFHPETFTYKDVAELVQIAANAFTGLGLEEGDVVALFGENSPRWLIVDQGLMRVGASDAVRGASAPGEELHYILNDSQSIALIVQNF
mgnify:CR=1 FL=1